MMRRVLILLIVFLFGILFLNVVLGYEELQSLRPLAQHYVAQGPIELGVPNIVTAILITYRGFDTLGEVAVLFMVAASVGLLLKKNEGDKSATEKPVSGRKAGEIVATGAAVLMPFIFTFGGYVIVNGHLSAGGGFQGGAIVASGVMLLLLARPESELNITMLSIVESLAGVFYILIGVSGIILAGGFLDGRFLPLGEFGAFISAGAVPLISALIGIKVACGYITGGTAPIIDAALSKAEAVQRSVDPVPSALAVTAIVIGFSVTAIMLSFAIRLYNAKKTLSIDAFTESKW